MTFAEESCFEVWGLAKWWLRRLLQGDQGKGLELEDRGLWLAGWDGRLLRLRLPAPRLQLQTHKFSFPFDT